MVRLATIRWQLAGLTLFAAALAVFAVGLAGSALVDARQAEQQTIINNYARAGSIDQVREKVLAEAYWRRNPDVAADDVYGAASTLGVFGAREHFNRHGRVEGRKWGP
ncbi:MAG: hypothetical protein ABJ215_00825 [Alphaproteobacteria bacterium]